MPSSSRRLGALAPASSAIATISGGSERMCTSPFVSTASFANARALSLRLPFATARSKRLISRSPACERNSSPMSSTRARAYHTSSVFIRANSPIACRYSATSWRTICVR